MPKAKLTTRERTTSNVSTDNLNKGSELSFAEADSNFINLRDASFGIADDSSTVLQVTDDKTITIAGGTNVTTALSGDTLTINSTADTGDLTIDTYTNSDFGVDTVRLQVPAGEDLELNAGTGGGPGGSGDRLIKMMDRVLFFKELNSDGTSSNLHFAPNGTGLIQHYTGTTGYTFPRVTGNEQGKVLVMGGIDGSSVNQLGFSDVLDNLSTMKAGDVKIIDNTIATQSSNANLELDASGTGKVVISGLVFPNSDGSAGQVISTDGSGNLSFTSAGTGSVTPSSTDTFTNKTFDANGTGNSISNLEVADFAAASIITAGEGIGSNNNDTTIPTSAAVKAYADSVGPGVTGDLTITGSTITAPSNADLTLTPGGTGRVIIDGLQFPAGDGSNGHVLVTNGSGDLSFTAPGSVSTFGDFTAIGSTMASPTNADITLDPGGTGHVIINVDGSINTRLKVGTGSSYGAITSNGSDEELLLSVGDGSASNARIIIKKTSDGGDILLNPKSTGRVNFDTATSTTIGSNGSASAPTANPVGYVKVKINGTEYQIPYYNV